MLADSFEANPRITPAYVATKDDERRLVIAEQFDFKQDKSLSAVRFVCKNAGAILKRRDSSGSILRDGSAKKGSFLYSLSSAGGPVTLRPGYNTVVVEAAAGRVGRFVSEAELSSAGEETANHAEFSHSETNR